MMQHNDLVNFGKQAKKEILSLSPKSDCCYIAFLSAFINTCGSVLWDNGELIVLFEHENETSLAKLNKIITYLYKTELTIEGNKAVIQGDFVKTMLLECGYFFIDENGDMKVYDGINKEIIFSPCCKVNFIRGAFIGSGSVSILSGYHLEFSLSTPSLAKDLCDLLAFHDIHCKTTSRKDKTIVYIKDREQISDLLALLGASKSVIILNDEMVYRSVRQDSNRASNCDIANLDKTLNASIKQIDAINYIDEKIGIDTLDERLKEIALIRLANDDFSLSKISQMLGISKSTVKNRMNKILLIAEELHNE